MTAQHLTTPHSADQIEHTHTIESSEGHQVPGPPHSHGHDDHHHGPDTGPVTAVIVIAVLLIGAAWIGLRAPEVAPEGHLGPRQVSHDAVEGVIVLQDGQVFTGAITTQPRTFTVRDAEGQEVVLPRERVRWKRTDGTTLTDEYWRQFGHLPVEATQAGRGRGIVVLDTGDVFVGRVLEDAADVTVRFPSGGEVTIPRERVRWVDAGRERLTDKYWQEHGDAPIDPRWQRGETRGGATPQGERRGAALPGGAAPRDLRANATLAQTGGRWAEATAAWAELYRDKQLPTDLTNLLTCADALLQQGFRRTPAVPTTDLLRELLEPLAHVPVVRQRLADAFFQTAMYYIGVHDVGQARRWTTALQGVGDPGDRAPHLLQAAAHIQQSMEGHGHPEDE